MYNLWSDKNWILLKDDNTCINFVSCSFVKSIILSIPRLSFQSVELNLDSGGYHISEKMKFVPLGFHVLLIKMI